MHKAADAEIVIIIILDILYTIIGFASTIVCVTCFFAKSKPGKKKKFEQIEKAFCFGSAITGIGCVLSCDTWSKVWRHNARTKKIYCFIFSPSSIVYSVANQLTSFSMIYMAVLVIVSLNFTKQQWLNSPLKVGEIFLAYLLPIIISIVILCYQIYKSTKDDQMADNCSFASIFPPNFVIVYFLLFTLLNGIAIVLFLISVYLMYKQNETTTCIQRIRMRRKLAVHKQLCRAIICSALVQFVPATFKTICLATGYNNSVLSAVVWLPQPLGLAIFSVSMTRRRGEILNNQKIKQLSNEIAKLCSPYHRKLCCCCYSNGFCNVKMKTVTKVATIRTTAT